MLLYFRFNAFELRGLSNKAIEDPVTLGEFLEGAGGHACRGDICFGIILDGATARSRRSKLHS